MNAPPSSDRRSAPRAHVALVASLFQGEECIGQYLVRNLSLGGVLLISGPILAPGSACRVVLRGACVSHLSVAGETLRTAPTAGEAGLAVSFRDVTPSLQAELQHVVDEAMQSVDRPGVLVYDADADTLAALAEDLHLLGRRALLALTPLEAVRWLCDAHARVETALVGLHGRAGAGPDLLAFVAEEFPGVHRVLLHDDVAADELLAAIEESNARALLSKPWNGVELAAALRREARRASLVPGLSRAS